MGTSDRISKRLLLPLRTADARIATGRTTEGRDEAAPNWIERSRHFSSFQRSCCVELWRCLLNSEKSSFRPYARVRSFDDLDPDLAIYRQRTIHFLRRYFQMSMEVGRVPSLLGREVFRTRVTSYRMGTFEDTVIFVHDIERCLERLDPESQSLIVRIVFQDYTQEEAAAIFGCTVRTLSRRFPEALDRMTQILIDCGLLKRIGSIKSRGRLVPQENSSLYMEEIDACSQDVYPTPIPDTFRCVSA
jgi:hypothetical protein